MRKPNTNSHHPNPHLVKYDDDFHVNVDSGLKGIKKRRKKPSSGTNKKETSKVITEVCLSATPLRDVIFNSHSCVPVNEPSNVIFFYIRFFFFAEAIIAAGIEMARWWADYSPATSCRWL